MDPADNSTSVPNLGAVPNSEPTPTSTPTSTSEVGAELVNPTPLVGQPVPSVASVEQPVSPAVSNVSPVNTVVTPGVNPLANNPAFRSEVGQGLAATEPIMRPERMPEPDPVEEELKAPMKAAGPVPGSIGSAVSGAGVETNAPMASVGDSFTTTSQVQTPSVPFNDPAMQPDVTQNTGMGMSSVKKKNNKALLVTLIVVAVVVAIVLAVILVMQLMSGGNFTGQSSNSQSSGGNSSNVVVDDSNTDNTTTNGSVTKPTTGILSCTRNMTEIELVGMNDAVSGTISISASFNQNEVSSLTRIDSVVYLDENGDESEPVDMQVHEGKVADLTGDGYLTYYLPADTDAADLTVENVQEIYEGLDFTCEIL